MTIVNGYITQDEAIAWMRMNSLAASNATLDLLDDVITGVSRDIDEYCGRTFYPKGTVLAPVTRTVTAATETLVDVTATPVATVTTVKIDDGTGTFPTTITDYILGPPEAPIDHRAWTTLTAGATPWPLDPNLVQISGVWGDPTPEPVRIACQIQVARMMARPSSPLGLAGGFGEFGAMRVFGGGWDQDALARLDPYRTPERKWGIA